MGRWSERNIWGWVTSGEKQGERKGKQAKGLLGEVKRERNDEETNSFLWKYRRYN